MLPPLKREDWECRGPHRSGSVSCVLGLPGLSFGVLGALPVQKRLP